MDGKGSKNTHKKQEERSTGKNPFKTMYLPRYYTQLIACSNGYL